MDFTKSVAGKSPDLSFLAPPQTPDELGRLAHYRVLGVLGRGAMGIVFEAEDTHLRRLVALKVMSPHLAQADDARARFLREARAAAALKHDQIVTIYQVGEERGIPFLAMERLNGKSLDDWLRPDRRAGVTETLSIGKQIAKGLAAAHEAGLIHRDIKPSNLWLEAPRWRIKILDFGLARRSEGEFTVLTQDGALVGTPAFMAPEQARGEELDARCDLFSFGCVLYRMVTGRLPFQGPNLMAVLAAVTAGTPTDIRSINPEVPPKLADLIHRLLSKESVDRPRSARAVLEELMTIEKGLPGSRANPVPHRALDASISDSLIPTDQTSDNHEKEVASTHWFWKLLAIVVPAAMIVAAAIIYWPSDQTSRPLVDTKTSRTIDLLALVDLDRDVLAGHFSRTQKSHELQVIVESKETNPYSMLRLPWSPPRDYRLRVQVLSKEVSGSTGVALALASGPGRFLVFVDQSPLGGAKRKSGMAKTLALGDAGTGGAKQEPSKKKVAKKERTSKPTSGDRLNQAENPLIPTNKPTWIEATVRPEQVVLTVDGKQVQVWNENFDQFKRGPRMFSDNAAELGLSFARGGNYRVLEVLLEPLEANAGHQLKTP